MGLTNWAGNVTFEADRLHEPTSIEQLQHILAASRFARPLGTRHSFNRIADSAGDLISAAALPPSVTINEASQTATVSAGMRYGDVAPLLHAHGWALRNLGSLPHISVAGACATGTHGSGSTNGSLSSAVRGIEMVTAQGDLVTLRRDSDPATFPGAVVALGCLGVVTKAELSIVPTFDVRQYVYDNMPMQAVLEHFDEIADSAYSVSLFTTWRGPNIDQVWTKQKADDEKQPPPQWLGATLAGSQRHPIVGMPVSNSTEQLGVPGPWHARLPHFRLEFVPSKGDELQSEYLLPREHAASAIEAVFGIAQHVSPVLQVSEIRTIAADDLWLSPAYGRASVALHFTWAPDEDAVLAVLPRLEAVLAEFEARPHWAKLFTTPPDVVRELYPRWSEFEALLETFDPAAKLRNPFVERLFG